MATSLPAPGDPNVLYVVDLSGYVFRAYHALPPMSTRSGEPTHAVYGVTQMLLSLVATRRPARLAVALDAPGPSFRRAIFDGYKATRRAHPPDLDPQVERLEEVVEAYGIPILSAPGFEADDLIATLVERAREAGLEVVVVSADKDLLQLVGPGVTMYDSMRERVYGPAEAEEKMGVRPSQIADFLALTGDSSDNVPGVPSVGPKTAARLLAEHGTLDALYAHLDAVAQKGTREKLAAHRDDAYLSRELVTLRRDAPVRLDLDALRHGGADEERLRALFTELEMHKLLGQLAPAPVRPVRYGRPLVDPAGLAAALAAARAAGCVAIYTLAEPGPARDAPIAGVALSWEPGQAVYVPLGHLGLGAPSQLAQRDVVAALAGLFAEAGVVVCTAELARELGLWARAGLDLSRVRFDAALASYLLDPERHGHTIEEIARSELHRTLVAYDALAEAPRRGARALVDVPVERARDYACARADAARTARERLGPRLDAGGLRALLDDVEIPLAGVLSRMEREGIALDTAHLARLREDYAARIVGLEAEAFALVGRAFKIGSPRALEEILFDELGLRVVKRTKTARSTDAEVLEELADEHALPQLILEHRALSKLSSTYLDALPRAVHPDTGRVHTTFHQAVTATGRLSSSDPNLQNIPIRTPEGRAIRDAFVARDGWQLLSADYSQIELRVLAHLSGDPELREAFAADEDVHARTARAIFETHEVTEAMRGAAKTVNYAVIYGQTHFALARNLGVSREEAQRYIDAFFARYAGVARFMDATVEEARTSGGVRTLLGRWRGIGDIRSRNRALRAAAERVARNTPIQGSAADLLKVAMIRIDAELRGRGHASKLLLTVHDELLLEIAPGELDAVRALVRERMEHAMELAVPIAVSIGVGRTWSEAH
ncbi:MAG: DNA polymerase I [Sandaracinaceae bacterium]|nr:DNA polymerase I [Sandaracinaceae bacterium]